MHEADAFRSLESLWQHLGDQQAPHTAQLLHLHAVLNARQAFPLNVCTSTVMKSTVALFSLATYR